MGQTNGQTDGRTVTRNAAS